MFGMEVSGSKTGVGEDERQWNVTEGKRSQFLDYDVLHVLLIRTISQNVRLFAVHKVFFSKSLLVYILSVALFVDCNRKTGNLGHLWSKR